MPDSGIENLQNCSKLANGCKLTVVYLIRIAEQGEVGVRKGVI